MKTKLGDKIWCNFSRILVRNQLKSRHICKHIFLFIHQCLFLFILKKSFHSISFKQYSFLLVSSSGWLSSTAAKFRFRYAVNFSVHCCFERCRPATTWSYYDLMTFYCFYRLIPHSHQRQQCHRHSPPFPESAIASDLCWQGAVCDQIFGSVKGWRRRCSPSLWARWIHRRFAASVSSSDSRERDQASNSWTLSTRHWVHTIAKFLKFQEFKFKICQEPAAAFRNSKFTDFFWRWIDGI